MFEEDKQPDPLKKKLLHKLNPHTNIIHYEEMPSLADSPHTLRNSESNQRTPEVFKSLAKLDQSDDTKYLLSNLRQGEYFTG